MRPRALAHLRGHEKLGKVIRKDQEAHRQVPLPQRGYHLTWFDCVKKFSKGGLKFGYANCTGGTAL